MRLEITHSLALVELESDDPTDDMKDFYALPVCPMPGTLVTGCGRIRGVFTAEDASIIEAWAEGRAR